MSISRISLIFVFSCAVGVLLGQKQIDIKLQSSNNIEQAACFDVLLRSAQGHVIDLAGQNYRLFYPAHKLTFLPESISHDMDANTYTTPDVISSIHQNIGFLSISVDSKQLTDKIIKLDRGGDWLKTLNLCFEGKEDQYFDLTWANKRKTGGFATAEVAFSEWESSERQQILSPNEVIDYTSLDDEQIARHALDIHIFPNPVVDELQVSFASPQSEEQNTLIIMDVIGREQQLIKIKP